MDSSDKKFTSENKGTVEMVKEWKVGSHKFVRCNSIMFWLLNYEV
jgi:hypothetical protein